MPVTTEAVGIINPNGSGMGLQVRYLHNLSTKTSVEGGFTFSSSSESSRFFVAGNQVLYPEFSNQPKISLKGLVESSSEQGTSKINFGLAPVISKGIVVKDKEIFPFFSIPLKLSLDSKSNKYNTIFGIGAGLTTEISYSQNQFLILNFEGNLGLSSQASTALLIGATLPL